MITFHCPHIWGAWRAEPWEPGRPQTLGPPVFQLLAPQIGCLPPRFWGRHANIYLPDHDSKPVCDLNIVSVQAEAEGEWGPKTQPWHWGKGDLRSAPRNACDSVSAWSLFALARSVHLFPGSAALLFFPSSFSPRS